MNKLDMIIGLYRANAHIKDNKAAKSTNIHVYDVVRRSKELGNTKNCSKTELSRSYSMKSNIKVVRERIRRDS